jgi:peptide/nickel transport system permease protein
MHLVGRAAVELEVARQRDRVGAALLQTACPTSEGLGAAEFRPPARAPLRTIAASRRTALALRETGPNSPSERSLRRAADRRVDVGAPPRAMLRQHAAVGRVLERSVAPLARPASGRRSNTCAARTGSRRAMRSCSGDRAGFGHDSEPRRRTRTSHRLFLLKRFATFVATLLAASAVIFAVLDVLPGNVRRGDAGRSATPEAVQALRRKLGLDRPPLERYARWMQRPGARRHGHERRLRHAGARSSASASSSRAAGA